MRRLPQCLVPLGPLLVATFACDGPEPQPSEKTSASTEQPSLATPPARAPAPVAPPAPAPKPWGHRPVEKSGFPCDVEDVLARSCRRCHFSPRENDAPFSLVRWEDTRGIRSKKPIFELMLQMIEADLMPPTEEPLSPRVEPLTAEQKTVLVTWLKGGALKAEGECPPAEE